MNDHHQILNTNAAVGSEAGELAELRRLIIGPEQVQLRRIKEIIDSMEVRPEDVGRVLAEAVQLRAEIDNKLSLALIPTVEETVRASIRKDPAAFESILSPVIGKTIRAAIAHALQARLQSFNQTLVQSLSWQGLKWRLEAMRTGKPFAEVVLLHSLLYRVEQVLLIHRETGLILQHVAARDLESFQDADIVSGMLTAIQDFARDSFNMDEGDALKTFQVGELTVWVVQGDLALLAAVIRGDPPERLRTTLQNALDEVHFEKRRALVTFDGDSAEFDSIRYCLESCFDAQYRPRKKGRILPWLLFLLLLAVGVLGLYHAASYLNLGRSALEERTVTRPIWPKGAFFEDPALVDLRKRLGDLHGVMVIDVRKSRDGGYVVSGLKDPLAPDPSAHSDTWLSGSSIPVEAIDFQWRPYQSLDPDFVLKRAKRLLAPPLETNLSFADGVLTVQGTAPHDWVERLKILAPVVPGVEAVDINQLTDQALAGRRAAMDAIKSMVITFIFNTSQVRPDQAHKLKSLVKHVKALERFSQELNQPFEIKIIGHTDSTGTERRNKTLSWERAQKAKSFLVENSMDLDRIQVEGVADSMPVREEKTEEDKAMNRSVTFQFIQKTPPLREKAVPAWP